MADGYDVDPDALAALGTRLGAAESDLGTAAGADPVADAGQSTAALLTAAALQAEGMAALGQALARSATDLAATAVVYRAAETSAAGGFPAGTS
jgi:hypothetical protein